MNEILHAKGQQIKIAFAKRVDQKYQAAEIKYGILAGDIYWQGSAGSLGWEMKIRQDNDQR